MHVEMTKLDLVFPCSALIIFLSFYIYGQLANTNSIKQIVRKMKKQT
jgi:hypothetical protein